MNLYYEGSTFDDSSVFLSHHGIKGQKWGVRNGPPYPLQQSGKSVSKDDSNEKKIRAVRSLYDKLDSFDYGGIVNGKRIDDESYYDIDFGKDYRTIPIETMEKEKIGNCWDFVNYQHDVFKKNGIPDETYMFVAKRSDDPNDPNDVVTHTFSTIDIGGKKYWFEQAFYKYRGIHEINDLKDVVNTLNDAYKLGNKPLDVFKFNPDGMDRGLTDSEYFNRATADDPVFQRKKTKRT